MDRKRAKTNNSGNDIVVFGGIGKVSKLEKEIVELKQDVKKKEIVELKEENKQYKEELEKLNKKVETTIGDFKCEIRNRLLGIETRIEQRENRMKKMVKEEDKRQLQQKNSNFVGNMLVGMKKFVDERVEEWNKKGEDEVEKNFVLNKEKGSEDRNGEIEKKGETKTGGGILNGRFKSSINSNGQARTRRRP